MSTSKPLPLQGKVALITGANTGIGRVTARQLASLGARVIIASRSAERTTAALDEIRAAHPQAQVQWLALDLGDLASVRRCAQAFLALDVPLHLLINNAGLAGGRGLTPSGFELAFGTNHLGPFLLTQLLLERIGQSGAARIVTVASRAHVRVKLGPGGVDWEALRQPTRTRTGFAEYGFSKLANVWFNAELARRLAGSAVRCHALHPGVVASDVWRRVPWPIRPLIKWRMLSVEEGAATTLYCATSPDLDSHSGGYYDRCRSKAPSALGQDGALAAEVWRRSEAWVAQ